MGIALASEVPSWQKRATNKRDAVLASIPLGWRIPEMKKPDNALEWLRTSGSLTTDELAITEITQASALLEKLASGQLTAVEVVNAYSKRAALAQQLIGCCTEMFFDDALSHAIKLDEYFQRTGKTVGPLHGLPISLKDLLDVKGQDTTWGWVGLIEQPAKENCPLVEVLVAQGAVPYVKTNLSQSIMMSDSYNHIFKQSVHPWNRKLISGGSSGGEGALIACRGSIVGFGTDTGGSIRIPAHLQGLYGLCPSVGRIPFEDSGKRSFISPPVTGPMASSLSTIEIIMEGLLSGEPWMHDPVVAPLPWRKSLAEKPAGKLRIGFYLDDGYVLPQPPQTYAAQHVVNLLKEAGHDVFEWSTAGHTEMTQRWSKSILADGGDVASKHCDLSGEPLIEGMIIGTEADRLTISEMESLASERVRDQKQYLKRWHDSALDAIIMPLQPWTGFKPGDWVKSKQYLGYSALWNWLGFTAMSVPVMTVDELNSKGDQRWADHQPRNPSDEFNYQIYDPAALQGMPVGVQVVCCRFQEEKAIAISKVIDDLLL